MSEQDTFCPCCGAQEADWNGPRADIAYMERDQELDRLRARVAELEAKLAVAEANLEIARANAASSDLAHQTLMCRVAELEEEDRK